MKTEHGMKGWGFLTTSVTSQPQKRRAASVSCERARICVRVCVCAAAFIRSAWSTPEKQTSLPAAAREVRGPLVVGMYWYFSLEWADHVSGYQHDGHMLLMRVHLCMGEIVAPQPPNWTDNNTKQNKTKFKKPQNVEAFFIITPRSLRKSILFSYSRHTTTKPKK